MIVVDAGCLFEVVAATPNAAAIGARLAHDDAQAAPLPDRCRGVPSGPTCPMEVMPTTSR